MCNVHYQRSVSPVQGTRRAQIPSSRQWMLHTAPPAPPGHWAGPALRGQVLGEPQREQTDPAWVTRCWPVLCCPTPSCCCSPPWGKEVGMRRGLNHKSPSKICIPGIAASGHRSFQRGSRGMAAPRAVLGGGWGGFPHFTPSLWKLGLGKQSQPFPHATTHGSWRIPAQVTVCPNPSDPAPTHTPPHTPCLLPGTHLKSCRAFLFFLRFSSSMGYSLKSSRLSRISPTGTADTNIFRVKFTWPGWEQPRVWYPAKLWAQRHLQAEGTGLAGAELLPVRRALEQKLDLEPI